MVYHPQYDFLWHSWLYQFPAYNPSMVSHPLDPECQGKLPRSRPGSSLQICFLSHPMHMVIHPSQTRFPPVPYSCKCCFPSPKLSVVSCIHREPYSMFMTQLRKPPRTPFCSHTLYMCLITVLIALWLPGPLGHQERPGPPIYEDPDILNMKKYKNL